MKKKVMFILSCLLLSLGYISAQTTRITGTVVDSNGEPVVSASVVVKGTTIGTTTDLEGRFSINVPEGNNTLVFTLIGMITVEAKATQNMRIVMENDDTVLDEVMVVAYGTVKKESFTGAAGVVSSKDITKIQASSLSKALEGAVPGLQVASVSGQPGSNAVLRIRGYGSLAAGNSPLIVVDGTPYDGSMNAFNPQDIESISVLKDAASAALYGSRAANGVLLITTKKGAKGIPKVSLDIKQGLNVRGVPLYDTFSDPGQYLETLWQSLYNDDRYGENPGNSAQYASDNLISRLGNYNPYLNVADNQVVGMNGKLASGLKRRYTDDWIEEAFKTGYRQEYNVNISSGTEKMTSYMSLGYLEDKGIIDQTGFERFSGRLNVSYDITNNFKVDGSIAYSHTDQKAPKTSATSAAANMFNFVNFIPPVYPVYMYDLDGRVIRDEETGNKLYDYGDGAASGGMPGTGVRDYSKGQNPIGDAKLDSRQEIYDNVMTRGVLEYSFLDGFKATVNMGYDVLNRKVDVYFNKLFGDSQGRGRVQKDLFRYETITLNQLLNYSKTFNKVHNVSILAGHESYKYRMSNVYAHKQDVFISGIPEFDNAMTMTEMTSSSVKKTIESYLSQLLYDYDSKYYFSASFRRDGSSIFHKDNRWGNFWSVAGAWRISQEDFFDWAFVDNLKIRTSYGVSGNDQILDEDGFTNYLPYKDQYTLDPTGGLSKVYKGNPDLKWETNKSFNAGFDLTMFNNRLNMEFDFYTRKASDLLYNRPLPPSTGDSYVPENIGDMKNTGIEFTISGDVFRTPDFRWNLLFSGNHNKNKITSLNEDEIIKSSTNRILRIGGTIFDFYLTEYAGVDKETGDALYYYMDSNGEKKTTNVASQAQNSRIVAGTSMPDFNGTLGTTFEYKGFDLSVMTTFQLGGKILNSTYASLMHSSGLNNWHKDILGAWSETNINSNIPRLGTDYQDANELSTRFLQSSNYFNLRNVTLGYTFKPEMLRDLKISGLRVYVVGDNLALLTKMKGLDPRQGLSGGVTGRNQVSGRTEVAYSPIRSYSLGLSLNF